MIQKLKTEIRMNILFRVDTSNIIGSGHLLRCLNLAEHLDKAKTNCNIIWATTEYPNNLISRIPATQKIIRLAPDPHHVITSNTFTWLGDIDHDIGQIVGSLGDIVVDLLVIDHYGIDYRWESSFVGKYPFVKILVIDDLFNRMHICDWLVDSTYCVNYAANNYSKHSLVSADNTKLLLGCKYVMLNREFRRILNDDECVGCKPIDIFRINVSFGGADLPNMTLNVVECLIEMSETWAFIEVDIILGGLNKNRDSIVEVLKSHNLYGRESNFQIYQNIGYPELTEMLCRSSIGISAGGVSLYERCCLGVPSVVITLAENQINNAQSLEAVGAIHYLGGVHDWNKESLIDTIDLYRTDPAYLRDARQICYNLVDGLGCKRIVDAILG